MYHFQPRASLGSYYDTPPFTTHLPVAESSLGQNREDAPEELDSPWFDILSITPFLTAYGAYKNNGSSFLYGAAGFVGGVLLNVAVGIPAAFTHPALCLAAPALGGWYAWKASKRS